MELDGHGWPAAGESLFPGRAAVGAHVRGAEEEAREVRELRSAAI